MDRSELSEASIHEVGTLFEAEVRAAGPELVAADLEGMERRVQQLSRVVCGALLERVLARRAAEPPPAGCPTCGGRLRLVERARARRVQGLTGDATLRRAVYVWTQAACGAGYAPLDAALGLGAATLTPGLARVARRAGMALAFAEAAQHLEEALGLRLADETVRRVSEAVGAVAEAAQPEAIDRAQQGGLPRPAGGAVDLVVAVDGVQVPLGPTLQTDARSGRTSLAWGRSVCCAGLESAEPFRYRVYVAATQAGLSAQTRRVVVLGDGGEWIWARAAHFVGGAGGRWWRSWTSTTPTSICGTSATPSSRRPRRPQPGSSRSRMLCMSAARGPRWRRWTPCARRPPRPPRRSVPPAPTAPRTPRAWTTRASSPGSCRSARARWRAYARP